MQLIMTLLNDIAGKVKPVKQDISSYCVQKKPSCDGLYAVR